MEGAPLQRRDIVPAADHHVHLLGPYALPLPAPLPPEVELPAELSRLLVERARLLGNVSSPADLDTVFTEDAQLLNAFIAPTEWLRDRHWFMRYLNLWSQGKRRFVPNHYALSGSTGHIAGTVLEEESGEHSLNFLLAVKKGTDGRWRIHADSTTEKTPPRYGKPITAEQLIAELDEAGIQRAVVLSEAFWLGGPGAANTRRMTEAPDEASSVRGENDWTAQQVALHPGRLVMACAVNPLKDYAIPELERCAKLPQVRAMKLNFGDSGVSFDSPEHLAKVRHFFEAANRNRLALIVHLEPGKFYGPKEVELFLHKLASAAPDITLQVAHLAGNGPGITSPEALEAFARARTAKDPRAENLYFDFAGLVHKDLSVQEAELMATRMRQLGLERVLYASDVSPGMGTSTAQQWAWTRQKLPLTDEELRQVAGNVPPYLR